MRLLIDVDGCITRYDFKFLAKKYFNVDLSPLAIYAYDLADVLGVAPLAINTMFKEQVYGKPNFEDNALEVLNELHKEHSIVIYTNRTKYMETWELVEWLNENKIPFDGIDMNGSGAYDFHIDDSPAKLMSTNSITKLLYFQPWNKSCLNITGELRRVHNWDEIRKEVA